jgi:hypothetical protein
MGSGDESPQAVGIGQRPACKETFFQLAPAVRISRGVLTVHACMHPAGAMPGDDLCLHHEEPGMALVAT